MLLLLVLLLIWCYKYYSVAIQALFFLIALFLHHLLMSLVVVDGDPDVSIIPVNVVAASAAPKAENFQPAKFTASTCRNQIKACSRCNV